MYYEKFQKLCEIKGVKPSEVSRATGVATATLSSWKSGKYTPGIDKLRKIADYFNVSVEYITQSPDVKNPQHQTGYYLDDETAQAAQEIFENRELRVLFDAARDAKAEDIQTAYNVLMALKRKEENE